MVIVEHVRVQIAQEIYSSSPNYARRILFFLFFYTQKFLRHKKVKLRKEKGKKIEEGV